MESHEDWCIFKKIGTKEVGVSSIDVHSSELISVNNDLGWVFIVEISKLRIIKSSDIISYFESSSPSLTIDFIIPITKVCADKLSKNVAIVQQDTLLVLGFSDLIKGKKSEIFQKQYTCPIRKIEWLKDQLAVLGSNFVLEILNNNVVIGQKQGVQAFTFMSYSKGVICVEGLIMIVNLPDFVSLSQTRSTLFAIGLHCHSEKIFKMCIDENVPHITVYEKDLSEIQDINVFDSFPFSPQSMLECDLTQLPIISFSVFFASRSTLLISSTISVSLDVIMHTDQFEKVNFEENIEGECKIGWTDGKECVFRGFGVITNYADNLQNYKYFTKDTEYVLAQPPLVVFIGNNGNLGLARLLDLRKEFLNDRICGVFNDSHLNIEGFYSENKQQEKKIEEIKLNEEKKIEENKLKEEKKIEEKKFGFANYSTNLANPFLKPNQEGFDGKKNEELGKISESKGMSFIKPSENPFLADPNKKPAGIGTAPEKSGFFLSTPSVKTENLNISSPLLSGESLFGNKSLPGETQSKSLAKPSESLFSAPGLLSTNSAEKPAGLLGKLAENNNPFGKPSENASNLFFKPPENTSNPFGKPSENSKPSDPSVKSSSIFTSPLGLSQNSVLFPKTSENPSLKPSEVSQATNLFGNSLNLSGKPAENLLSSNPFVKTPEKNTSANSPSKPESDLSKGIFGKIGESNSFLQGLKLNAEPFNKSNETISTAENVTGNSQPKSLFGKPSENSAIFETNKSGINLFNKPAENNSSFPVKNEGFKPNGETLIKNEPKNTQPLGIPLKIEEISGENNKITTVSSKKIQELDEIFQLFKEEMEKNLNSAKIEGLESKLVALDKFSKALHEKFYSLRVNYITNTEKTNQLFRNLEEISYGIQYITQIWRSQQNTSSNEENLDINLVKSVDNIQKSVKTLELYLEKGIDQVVDSVKSLKNCLGIIEKSNIPENPWKKTKTFSQNKPKEFSIGSKEAEHFIKYKIESLKSQMESTENKFRALNRSLRKKQQKVYNFSIDDDEDIQDSPNETAFIDPVEYTSLFKNLRKNIHKK